MHKLKTVLILLLTAALIAGGAVLPRIVSSATDEASIGKEEISPIHSVELEVVETEERESASMARKLILLQDMYVLPLTEEEASMGAAEAIAAAEIAMEEYTAAGIFQWFDVDSVSAEPFIGIDPRDMDNYNIYWTVYFDMGEEPYGTLLLYIDDETGVVLHIEYNRYDSFTMEGVWEANWAVMDAFTDVYFRQLGMSEVADYFRSASLVDEGEIDGGVAYRRYTIGDVDYGEIRIEFYVDGAGGFRTNFPAE